MKPETKEKLKDYHIPACGDGYKQYSKEKDCDGLVNKPCDSCLYNLKKRGINSEHIKL